MNPENIEKLECIRDFTVDDANAYREIFEEVQRSKEQLVLAMREYNQGPPTTKRLAEVSPMVCLHTMWVSIYEEATRQGPHDTLQTLLLLARHPNAWVLGGDDLIESVRQRILEIVEKEIFEENNRDGGDDE